MWRVKKSTFKVLYHNSHVFKPRYKSLGPNQQVQIDDFCNLSIKNNTEDDKKAVADNTFNIIERSVGISIIEPKDVKIPETCNIITTKTAKMKILTFDEVPGPQIFKYISNIWKYIPAAGTQITRSFMITVLKAGPQFKIHNKTRLLSFLFNEYGPVVRVTSPFGGDIVLLSRPEDMQSVFSQEGRFPIRSAFDSLQYYRLKCRNLEYSGLYAMQGEKWNQQRNNLDISLSIKLSNINEKVNNSCDKFINVVKKLRNNQDEVTLDFQKNLFKWSLECMGHVLFHESLGLLEDDNPPNEIALNLEKSLKKASQSLAACESGLQLWKLLETPHWKQLVKNCNILESLIGQYIKQTELKLHKEKLKRNDEVRLTNFKDSFHVPNISDEEESESLLHTLLENKKMKPEDILTTFVDMLIIGVNSTTSAMSFILYHLARSQRAQRKLFDELNSVEFLDSILTFSQLKKLAYLRACIRESLRLVPPFPVITRILQKNITIDGYRIPRGSNVLMATQIMGLQEKNFDDADRFYPERWLHPDVKEFHPLAALPFGMGPRKCIGENISEMMLMTLTAKIVHNYQVEYHYGDIKPTTKLVSLPKSPLRFRIIDRE